MNEEEVDVFLEPSCFFDDPMDAGNLISDPQPFEIQLEHLGVLSLHYY